MYLWDKGSGSEMAFYPNLNAADENWKKLNRDVRFRRALSLAIDRHEINQAIYYGLAKEDAEQKLKALEDISNSSSTKAA